VIPLPEQPEAEPPRIDGRQTRGERNGGILSAIGWLENPQQARGALVRPAWRRRPRAGYTHNGVGKYHGTYWAIFAVKLGNGDALDTLVKLITSHQAKFKAGYGPPRSYDAIEIQQAMAESGNAEKEFELAESLEERGELPEAISWYQKAALQDHEGARRALTRLKVSDEQ
jgi:hypothetical protein